MFFLAQVAQHAPEAAEHAEHSSPHIINWVTLLAKTFGDSTFSQLLLKGEKVIFSAIVIGLIAYFTVKISKQMRHIPSRGHVALEALVMMLDGLVCGVLGPQGRKYTPFVGSLFIYILVSNLFGLLPLQNSATAYLTTTAPMAVCVFLYVQWIGISKSGLKGYLYHLAGSPTELFGYLLVPLNLPLHILGEFIKPISLMFRLFGNIMAGHVLVAVFLSMGVQMTAKWHIPVGVPLHFPFLFLEVMVGTIQAFVFALLTTVYISMMLPHEHAEEHAPAIEHA